MIHLPWWKLIVVLLSVLAIAVLLAGCGDNSADASNLKPPKPKVITISEDDRGLANDYVWHGTIDGQECIVVGYRNPAVSCRWTPR